MSISNAYHPNSHSCMHTFCTTIPTSFYNFNCFLHLSAVTIGQMCYLLGGYTTNHVPSKKVYRLSLDDLISQATPSGTQLSTVTASPWQSLPDSPLKYSAAVAIGGSLLAVGGGRKDIYLYQIGSRSWGKVGELATERSSFTCTLLPDGRLLLVVLWTQMNYFQNQLK